MVERLCVTCTRNAFSTLAWRPQHGEPLRDAVAEGLDLRPRHDHEHERGDQRHDAGDRGDPGVLEQVEPVDRRQVREHVAARQHTGGQRPHEQHRRHRHVEDRLDEKRRGERRVRRALDAPFHQEQLQHVAAACRHDRVDTDAREVGAEDRPPAHLHVRVRAADDVPPRARARDDLHRMAEQRERERLVRDRADVVAERVERVENRVHRQSVARSRA
jgi:hypothetical protein